ncbi:MAG: 4Fe-4S binding protein [Bacteroidales bacterium]|nr:4Fe-4S binding protein [Bacteroidales bacterium]
MLRKFRIVLALVFFIGITLLLIGIGQQWWGWMAKLQFLPSCLAANAVVIIGITLLTILFGRIYCSVICPLGVFQDIVLWIRVHGVNRLNKCRVRHGRKPLSKLQKHFSFSPERKWLRYIFLGAMVASILSGIQLFVALVEPYSAYGRMVAAAVRPTWGAVAVAAIVTLALITLLSALYGRAWCNNVCPVGTVLSIFSRYSLWRPVIDSGKCTACHRCERSCKSSCIDTAGEPHIDYSRCVDCFDCIGRCPEKAVSFKFAYGRKPKAEKNSDNSGSRRAFLGAAAFLGASAIARAGDGNLAPVVEKQRPQRSERLVPPGSGSVRSFYDHCTACQLCISACPNDVLSPSTDLEHLMQPQMNYDKGWCRPECHSCSDVCPSGAITGLLEGHKLMVSIGTASVNPQLCILNRDGVNCYNCMRHCPSGAIEMGDYSSDGLKVLTVNEERCIGCGACEFVCPSRPVSAITVNGRSTHIDKAE